MKQLSYLNKYLYKYRLRFILGIFFVVFSNFFAIYPAQVVREAFDIIISNISQKPAGSIYEKGYFFSDLAHYFASDLNLTSVLLVLGGFILLLALLKGLFIEILLRETY